MNFDYNSFFTQANREFVKSEHQQRYGQFLMNYLAQNHPDVVIPQEYDCFYNNELTGKFLAYLSGLSQRESQ